VEKLKQILEKLKRFESENSMITDIVNEIENKINLAENNIEIDNEVKRLEKENLNEENNTNSNTQMHYATYNRYEEENEDDTPRLTTKWINKLLCSNYKLYYRTHELNEVLYLHFKGFRIIENLDTFTNLKVLYLEGNSIKKISGLEKLKNLTSLYLHENVIEKIENLDELVNLYNLNLSDNCITKIENLSKLVTLSNLMLKRNRIGINGKDDIIGLTELSPTVTVIDISENKIDEILIADEILVNLKGLRVLYLQGNECVRKIPHYRKNMISKLPELRYLDDRPVFEDERRFAEAFTRGGLDGEKRERVSYKKEKEEAELQRLKDFREMIENWKGNQTNPTNPTNKTNQDNLSSEKDDEKDKKEKREEEKRKLMEKCKSKAKSNKMEIKEEITDLGELNPDKEKNDENVNQEHDAMPDLEDIKNKKESGYIEYMLEKEMNKEHMAKTNFDELD
jgi:dynein assembly factor 1